MAKKEKEEDAKPAGAAEKASPEQKQKSSSLMLIIIIAVTVILCGGGGFAAALFISKQQEPQAEPVKAPEPNQIQQLMTQVDNEKMDYPIEAVVACLDEPSLSRYVRVTITLQMAAGFDKVNGLKFLDSNQSILRDWLTTYFAGLTLAQVQGSRNLERIKLEIYEEFNKILFKDKSLIERILFKEFVVQ